MPSLELKSNRTETQATEDWDVFLSHNGADKAWVTDLATKLESEPIEDSPSSRKIKVFLDVWDIQAGENIVTKLNEGLAKSRFVALIMSPEFFRSNWTALEWTHCVADDPRNTRGRMIPILHRDVSLDGKEAISFPAPFRALKRLDFRTPKVQEANYRELLNCMRGLPNPRGTSHPPTPGSFPAPGPARDRRDEPGRADEVPELLISNMLPVASSPITIWSAATALRKQEEVYGSVETGDGVIIHGGRLYTFAQLSDELCPLRAVIDANTISDKDRRDVWLADKDKGRLYTWLLNAYLRKFLEEIGLNQDEKERFFFPPTGDGQPVEVAKRVVTAQKPSPQPGQDFWVHLAADIRFYRIRDRFFLKIVPCWFFTHDGKAPLDGKRMGRMCIRWGGKQRNANILRDLFFWADLLKRGGLQINIRAGAEDISVKPLPATSRSSRGIRGDHIRFTKLMQFAKDELTQIAAEAELAEPDDEDNESASE